MELNPIHQPLWSPRAVLVKLILVHRHVLGSNMCSWIRVANISFSTFSMRMTTFTFSNPLKEKTQNPNKLGIY
jgi:hypothetical protein